MQQALQASIHKTSVAEIVEAGVLGLPRRQHALWSAEAGEGRIDHPGCGVTVFIGCLSGFGRVVIGVGPLLGPVRFGGDVAHRADCNARVVFRLSGNVVGVCSFIVVSHCEMQEDLELRFTSVVGAL